jgi:hypothetical protein
VSNHFQLNNGTLIVPPQAEFNLSGTANFNGKSVVLQSDLSGTAILSALPNNGANLTNATNVTVERYIPAIAKWRALCMPLRSSLSGNTIYNSWQNNGSVINGQGVLLWSPSGFPGFVLNTNEGASQNIRKYTGGVGFDTLTSTTNAPLFLDNKPIPYLVFVTDFHKNTGYGNMGTSTAATTLRATGSLFKGNYSTGTLATGFHMIPNPYPSPIDLWKLNLSNLDESVYLWDPLLVGFRGFGGYQTYNKFSGTLAPGNGSYPSSYEYELPSNSAFWVYSNGSGSVSLTENSKSDYSSNISLFRRSSVTNPLLRVNLLNSSNDKLLDGVAVAFNNGASAEVDTKDSKKFGMTAENIFIRRNNQNLAIECRPLVQSADTIYLGLNQLSKQSYRFQITATNMNSIGNMIPVLEDLYLKKQTVLDLNAANTIDFTVDNQPASSGNRFRVVFRQNVTTAVNTLDADKGISVYPNPIMKGQSLHLSFNNQPTGMYRLVLYDIAGVQVMNRVLQHNGGTAVQSVTMPDNIANGNYVAELTDLKGNAKQIKITVQ